MVMIFYTVEMSKSQCILHYEKCSCFTLNRSYVFIFEKGNAFNIGFCLM